jgi:hypothetical protein
MTEPTTGATWDDRPMFASDADVTVYWPDVRPCYEEQGRQPGNAGMPSLSAVRRDTGHMTPAAEAS